MSSEEYQRMLAVYQQSVRQTSALRQLRYTLVYQMSNWFINLVIFRQHYSEHVHHQDVRTNVLKYQGKPELIFLIII